MHQYSNNQGSSYTTSDAKAQSHLSSLAMLNNNLTRLHKPNQRAQITQLHKLSNVTNKVAQTKLVTQELRLCYTSKKVTSKLHKLTNYNSNYTSTMHMKVNTSLCKEGANRREDKDDTMILSRGSRACQHASPYCVDHSLCGSATNWHHTKPTRWAL